MKPLGIDLKSLKVKNSLIAISVMLPLIAGFLAYDLNQQSNSMRTALQERGIILAQTLAAASGKILTDAIDNGILTEEQVFDENYIVIPGTEHLMYPKYHTAFDAYTDKYLPLVQDVYLNDKVIIYAVTSDRNGYVPTHNTVYPKVGFVEPGGIGDNPARTKRIFSDPVGLASSRNTEPYLFQEYRRLDTGELMWDISAPIYVKGRHWGGSRIGFSIDETNRRIAMVRSQIIGGVSALTFALILLIIYITNRITEPVKRLEEEAKRIALGDLSAIGIEAKSMDEVGRLISSFTDMVDKLRHIAERTRSSAGLVATYTSEIQTSIQNAAGSANVAVTKMGQLSETMKKMDESTGAVAGASEKAMESLLKTEKTSERFMKQMATSSVVMTRASESVKELESHVEKLGDIIQFVALIADQASLLAQKAVTEAAIPGKAETDFPALAAEIQRRAQDAASATRAISSLFEKAQKYARQASITLEKDQQVVIEGYSAASEAYDSLKTIVTDLQDLFKIVKEVTSNAQQVSDGIVSVNTATENQIALLKGFTEAARVLNEAVGEMQETIASLKI